MGQMDEAVPGRLLVQAGLRWLDDADGFRLARDRIPIGWR